MAWYGPDGSLTPDSPEWWAQRLSSEIADRNRGAKYSLEKVSNDRGTRPALSVLDAWMRNEPPLPASYRGPWVEAWAKFLRASRSNYAELVVSSVSDRLVPLGWRTAVDSDGDGDAEAEQIAIETDLVLNAGDAVEDMLWSGSGYLLVGKTSEGLAITREDPMCTMVARSSATGRPVAGLRVQRDDWTGLEEHWLYRPGSVQVARHDPVSGRYAFVDDGQKIPGDVFPLVELRNRRGVGEFERHIDVLTRINDTMFTRMVLTKLQAHRQRAIEKDLPKDGVQVEYDIDPEVFTSGPDALWDLPPGARIWESGNADLNTVRAMVLDDVKTLCAITGTPLSDMVPDAANQSAKGTEVVQEKHFSRVSDRQRRADRALSRVLAVAFAANGDAARADASKISTIWAPIQRHSLTEKAQAASQLKGVWPFERIATDVMQERPSELPRLAQLRAEDALLYGEASQ